MALIAFLAHFKPVKLCTEVAEVVPAPATRQLVSPQPDFRNKQPLLTCATPLTAAGRADIHVENCARVKQNMEAQHASVDAHDASQHACWHACDQGRASRERLSKEQIQEALSLLRTAKPAEFAQCALEAAEGVLAAGSPGSPGTHSQVCL